MLFRFIHTKIIILDAARNVKRVLRRNFNYGRTIIIHHEEAHNNLVDEDYGLFLRKGHLWLLWCCLVIKAVKKAISKKRWGDHLNFINSLWWVCRKKVNCRNFLHFVERKAILRKWSSSLAKTILWKFSKLTEDKPWETLKN